MTEPATGSGRPRLTPGAAAGRWRAVPGLGLALLMLAGCGDPPIPEQRNPLQVQVSNEPLRCCADRIGGAAAHVVLPLPAGADPAFWQPDDAAIRALQAADLILLNGAGHEPWLAATVLPRNQVIDTSAAFADLLISRPGAAHRHGPDGAVHDHGGPAFTTWLDLGLLRRQAAAAQAAMLARLPEQGAVLGRNHAALDRDLEALDRAMRTACAPLRGQVLLASHPVYCYWARAYGLVVQPLLWEPDQALDDPALRDLDALRAAHPQATVFVWEGEPLTASRDLLAARGLRSVVVDPCGRRPANGDFLTVQWANIAALQALAAHPVPP